MKFGVRYVNDFIIEKFTELLIKQDMKDKMSGKTTYVKKTEIYKNLIQWFKEYGKNSVLTDLE